MWYSLQLDVFQMHVKKQFLVLLLSSWNISLHYYLYDTLLAVSNFINKLSLMPHVIHNLVLSNVINKKHTNYVKPHKKLISCINNLTALPYTSNNSQAVPDAKLPAMLKLTTHSCAKLTTHTHNCAKLTSHSCAKSTTHNYARLITRSCAILTTPAVLT